MPRLQVSTRSSHYDADARSLATYSQWYKAMERPEASDAEFLDHDDFELVLDDFVERFGPPGR